MATVIDMLILQFLAWIDEAPRDYGETMEAWRTSCPRLTVWEDATSAGLVRMADDDHGTIELTDEGRARLRAGC